MPPTAHILADDLRAAIAACFSRYPTRQAVTLPALERRSNVVITYWMGTRALPTMSGRSEPHSVVTG